uniref:Neur_chan_memb domain-containing protein n=1 Tax=Panagrellus redivivus TaxID=6233 RepID=A0A7E4VDJ9_PANRE
MPLSSVQLHTMWCDPTAKPKEEVSAFSYRTISITTWFIPILPDSSIVLYATSSLSMVLFALSAHMLSPILTLSNSLLS